MVASAVDDLTVFWASAVSIRDSARLFPGVPSEVAGGMPATAIGWRRPVGVPVSVKTQLGVTVQNSASSLSEMRISEPKPH